MPKETTVGERFDEEFEEVVNDRFLGMNETIKEFIYKELKNQKRSTDFKDETGEVIFEGDKLKQTYYGSGETLTLTLTGTVEWAKEYGWWSIISNEKNELGVPIYQGTLYRFLKDDGINHSTVINNNN